MDDNNKPSSSRYPSRAIEKRNYEPPKSDESTSLDGTVKFDCFIENARENEDIKKRKTDAEKRKIELHATHLPNEVQNTPNTPISPSLASYQPTIEPEIQNDTVTSPDSSFEEEDANKETDTRHNARIKLIAIKHEKYKLDLMKENIDIETQIKKFRYEYEMKEAEERKKIIDNEIKILESKGDSIRKIERVKQKNKSTE